MTPKKILDLASRMDALVRAAEKAMLDALPSARRLKKHLDFKLQLLEALRLSPDFAKKAKRLHALF
jgi:hypothetical protein